MLSFSSIWQVLYDITMHHYHASFTVFKLFLICMIRSPNLAEKFTNLARNQTKNLTPRSSWSLFFPCLILGGVPKFRHNFGSSGSKLFLISVVKVVLIIKYQALWGEIWTVFLLEDPFKPKNANFTKYSNLNYKHC